MSDQESGVVVYTLSAGSPYPLGASITETGVQFALYSRHGSRMWLALFENPGDDTPFREFELNPRKHRFGHVWSVVVEGLEAGVIYAYRVDGPCDPKRGHRYDARHYLIDPYAKVVVNNTGEGFPKNLVMDDRRRPASVSKPAMEFADTVIYETHVKGLTAHESAEVDQQAGAYMAAAEKAEYLKSLGITTVELLPVQECGEPYLTLRDPETGKRLTNYWGYNPLAFSAPAGRFASCGGQSGRQHEEFRAMVDAFHEHGLEVILDVVYNHTSEAGAGGPVQSFRGIDNSLYYLLGSKGQYVDYSGCGNTVNCAHPVVSDLIVESLRHWVRQTNVDGFRFDLASILNRDKRGHLQQASALVERIAEDPL
ncbi:MAG: alpha-amylase family glycosyl hydrolase, partial [Candidatus Hydrogenedentota bacterium]